MFDDSESERSSPEPAQKLLYHATGKLYRYLAGFAGEDPEEIERAYRDSFEEITAGADPVLIGDAIGHGIGLGLSLAERRRALQRYHDELVRRELAPPAYDAERIENETGEVTGIRVLVSEPDCRFFVNAVDEPELLVRTPEGGEVAVPLEFEAGPVEPVESGETVSEVIVRPEGWESASDELDEEPDDQQEGVEDDPEEDLADPEDEYLEAAREVVLEEPELALAAAEEGDANHLRLAGTLIESKPSIPFEKAPNFIQEAIRRVGLDVLEERREELADDWTESDVETDGGEDDE